MAFGFPASHSESYSVDTEDTLDMRALVRASIESLGWEMGGEGPDYILASVSWSARSWGEKISVRFLSDNSISVTSKCVWPIQCFDWGSNQDNTEKLIAAVKNEVAR
jgi:hypothetical protein